MRFSTIILTGAAALISAPTLAHHSFAMFDHEKMITINGTVKEFEWSNPHAWIHVVADIQGKPVEWSFEMGSVGQIAAQGWKRDSIKPGDKISVQGHPLKDGSNGGQYRSVKLANGETLAQTAPGVNNNLPR